MAVLAEVAPGSAVEVGGVRFDPSAVVAGTSLQLNGAGVRYKAIFKVYAAGLYLDGHAATTDAVLNAHGPRRMHVVMLRDIDADKLGRLFTKGLEDNISSGEFGRLIPAVIKMGEIFSQRKQLTSGESFSIDYVPGVGSTILVNGKPAAAPIPGLEFFNAMMKIWLGRSPADAQLKSALLGQAASRSREAF